MMCRSGLAMALLLSLSLLPARAHDEPKTAPAKEKAVQPRVYNETADAKADVENALRLAKKDNQRVLIQWGGNWCSWCILLNDRFKSDPKLARELLYEYRVVRRHRQDGQEYRAGQTIRNDLYRGRAVSDGSRRRWQGPQNQRTDPFETKNADDGKEGKNGHDRKAAGFPRIRSQAVNVPKS